MSSAHQHPASQIRRLTQRRTEEIFADLQRKVFLQTDRMFVVLMAAQWIFGIAAAYWISPRTWAGPTSEVHIHLWAAIFLGGAISALPIAFALVLPARAVTRYVIAIGQMLTSALLIHLTGGRIETHFHVFGSLAFLAFYRDWRVLVPATLVISADHLLRGLFWPQSVYGVLTVSIWRFAEHAGWVLFEDIVLVVACIRGTRELWQIAERTAEFEASEDRYRSVVDQTGDGIFVFDVESRVIVEHNAAFERLLDAPAGPLSMTIDDTLMPGDEDLEEAVARLLRDRAPLVTERRLRRTDGSCVDVSCTMSATSYARRRAICVVVRDISERRRIDADLRRARDAALESARAKSEFLANMSHEIRTPMNGVVGMTGLLLDTDLSAQQREFTETIRASGDALLLIINDILDFSKVEAGKLHFEVLDFDLRSALESAIDLLAERASDKGLELALLIEEDVPTDLRGDPGRLRQIVMNLVGNAIKFTERGEVILRVSLDEQTAGDALLRFEVQDTGIGISEAAQARLFAAFTQADGSTTRKYGGTGLGLAISKRLAELMGGQIGVRSVMGFGSTFWFTTRIRTRPAAASRGFEVLKGRRALIVDDHAINRQIVHHQLAAWGIDNHAVATGDAALGALRAAVACGAPFDLAVLDRQMPEMDGVMLARAIKADPAISGVTLIMMTSLGNIGDSEELQRIGISECMTKPVKQSQFRECLERVLADRSGVRSVPATNAVTTAAASRGLPRQRILVAEDNIVNQKVAVLQLRKLGYAADVVANGAEAIAALNQLPYDLVLMDCHMPDMDGYEAARAIRAQRGDGWRIPIIAMTANAMPGDRDECLAAGMDDYVAKPVKPAELAAVLARWLQAPAPPSGPSGRNDEPVGAAI